MNKQQYQELVTAHELKKQEAIARKDEIKRKVIDNLRSKFGNHIQIDVKKL